MAFTVTKKVKEGEGFITIGVPEEVPQGKKYYGDAEESLVCVELFGSNADRLIVWLDQSRGDPSVRPFDDEAREQYVIHGIAGIIFDANSLPNGATIASIRGRDDTGQEYRLRIESSRSSL